MERRTFLALSFVGGAFSVLNANDKVTKTPQSLTKLPEKSRTFNVTFNVKLKESGTTNRLWLPMPLASTYQQVVSEFKTSGNYDSIFISDLTTPTLYSDFTKKDGQISVNFTIQTQNRSVDFGKLNYKHKEKFTPEVELFLQPSIYVQTNGIVKEFAKNIVKGIKGDFEKAHAIYNWVATNMQRDDSIIGCGVGDAKAILESKKLFGKCTDISSVFVALCRSIGIPAREVFGIRLGQSDFYGAMGSKEDITKAQHCRAEFYLKGYGWFPCDPGDVTKVRLAEKLEPTDSEFIRVRELLFGNWEMCWCAYNTSRDLYLKPIPKQSPLNNFGYPYAEIDGNTLDYYTPGDFYYEFKSVQI